MDKKHDNVEKLVSKVLNLEKLMDYRPGSVVSRQVIKKKTGTVTVFAFDKGEGLSEHVAPFDALVYLVDGRAKITIAGKPFNLKKGEFIILPANKPHALQAVQRFKMALVMIRS